MIEEPCIIYKNFFEIDPLVRSYALVCKLSISQKLGNPQKPHNQENLNNSKATHAIITKFCPQYAYVSRNIYAKFQA